MGRAEHQKAVTRALSDAIVTVAEDELARLSPGLDEDKRAKAIESALKGLKSLQSGRMPDYENEWVALFYITWYQPAQINLAYSMINTMAKRRDPEDAVLTDSGKLHVVDFGCGALAMQFAVALAAADALQKGDRLASIRIDSMDTSQAMIHIGHKVWEHFKMEVRKSAELASLNEALEVVRPTTSVRLSHAAPTRGAESWLSALHTVYPTNVESVKDWLAKIVSRTKPDVGFITTHGSSERQLVRTVSPFMNGDSSDVIPEFEGELRGITKWRRDLGHQHNYLKGRVTWEWRPAASLIYTRQ